MEQSKIIINELKERLKPHTDVEIENLTRKELEEKYQNLRFSISEVIGVYS